MKKGRQTRSSGAAAGFGLPALFLLAACGGAEQQVAEDPPSPDPLDLVGSYRAEMADGKTVTHVLEADGTYRDIGDENLALETGTWRIEGDSICYDPEGSDPEACFAGGPTDKVKRVEETPAAETAAES